MRNSRQKVVAAIVASLLLVIIGWFFADYFLNFVLSWFTDLEVRFQSTELLGQYKSVYSLLFALTSFPIMLLLSNYFLRDEVLWKRLFVLPIMLICGLGFMFFHIYSLRADILSMPQISPEIQNVISLSSIHAARYLGIGFFFGAFMSTVLFYFTSKNRKA